MLLLGQCLYLFIVGLYAFGPGLENMLTNA